MRRKKIWTLGLVACLSLAIAGFADHKPGHTKGGGGGGGGGKIPVTVTFRDLGGSLFADEPDRIMSDCQLGDADPFACPYTDSAIIGAGSGSFHFGVGRLKPNKPVSRKLFLDFSDENCASGSCTPPPLPADGSLLFGSDGAVNVSTRGIDLREIAVGEFRDDLGLALGFDLNSIDGGLWSLRFNRDFADCPDFPASSPVTVTRIDDVTYEIEADPDDLACLGRLEGGGHFIFKGLYRMPFLITVVCEDPTQCVAP